MDEFNEYMDHDALSCIDDYNRFEENELNRDYEEDFDRFEDGYFDEDPSLGISDDNWACGTLDPEM